MRLVNRAEFLKLPNGTIFTKALDGYQQQDLRVKRGTYDKGNVRSDFVCSTLYPFELGMNPDEDDYAWDLIIDEGKNINACFDCTYRDGMFDEGELYLIPSSEDIQGLIDVLSSSSQMKKDNNNE